MKIVHRVLLKLGTLIKDAERAWTLSNLRSCGSGVRIDHRVFIWGADRMDIGSNVDINGYTVVYAAGGVRIGNKVLIGANCVITSVSHPTEAADRQQLVFSPVELQENCWLGAGTMVMPGVTIGRNSIVAAGSVVTKNIPDNCVFAGIPARLVRHLDSTLEQ
ncbi:acyltransferase [Variovorax sp. J22P168]|uniref:acyltransferase n=1 Tax=Variovorax jilinensis TaxID=3053513 RepID=UPI0025750151|nr:acyltransferase [Variovorax sp. J22P168]MDM0011271.1 acyltransferase [Variovorax sp. J22P168]